MTLTNALLYYLEGRVFVNIAGRCVGCTGAESVCLEQYLACGSRRLDQRVGAAAYTDDPLCYVGHTSVR